MRLLHRIIPQFLTAAVSLQAAAALWEKPGWNGLIEEAAFSADAATVACRLADGRVVVRQFGGAAAPAVFDCAPYAVTRVAISADGGRVAWGDYYGNLYSWSRSGGLVQALPKTMGLFGLALTADGASVVIGGDGVDLRIYGTSNLVQSYLRSAGLGQVRALAMDATAANILAADHDGKVALLRKSGTTYNLSSKTLSSSGIAGAVALPGSAVQFAVWDSEGSLIFLDTSLAILGTVSLPAGAPTAALADPTRGRLLLGAADGSVLSVNTATRLLAGEVAAVGERVAGLGLDSGQRLVILTETGRLYAGEGAALGLREEPAIAGAALAVRPSLQDGGAIVVTEKGVDRMDMMDGAAEPHAQPSADPVSSALLEARGLWSARTATMAASGAATVLREQDGQPVVEASLAADPATIWTGMAFTDSDRALLQWGRGRARLLGLPEGAVTVYDLGERVIPDALALDGQTRALYYATGSNLYRVAATGGGRSLVLTTAQDAAIIQVLPAPDGLTATLWTTAARLRVRLADGAVLSVESAAAPLAAAYPAGDGPFSLTLSRAGTFALERDASSPLVAAFPQLAPAAGGGMDSGYFGVIRAARDAWMLHREFGWGWVAGSPDIDWCWWPSEGWTAGGEAFSPYLYSYASANWLFTLVPAYPTNWVYDYAVQGWRLFGI